MWNRQLSLSPAEVAHGEEVFRTALMPSIHAFFEGSGEVLAPAFYRCEPVRLVNVPDKLNGSKGMTCGIIFSSQTNPSDVAGVILSENLGRPIMERYSNWPSRVADAAELARCLLGDLPSSLGWDGLSDPILVFDMHATVLQTVATMASQERCNCVLLHSFLRGMDLHKWAHCFALFDRECLMGEHLVRSAEAA